MLRNQLACSFNEWQKDRSPGRRELGEGGLRANVEGAELVLGGDIILGINGKPVRTDESYDPIYQSIIGSGSEQPVVITIFRQGQLLKLSIQTSD